MMGGLGSRTLVTGHESSCAKYLLNGYPSGTTNLLAAFSRQLVEAYIYITWEVIHPGLSRSERSDTLDWWTNCVMKSPGDI